ncbi:N-acyl-D-amino-acid deacylase family protein [Candidatus Magnetomonas plexicatena]|uniref:N-acyl-D-amino-acid deacylase family protein n=1 Tax=Candidatus Magnetomonas plexicatena TaxID=2552947 RepID=UPI001C73EDFB|nr:D-aminoacylase [Nitrospirales bacterium LBB_01]
MTSEDTHKTMDSFVIKNALVYDGTGAAPKRAAVGVKNGKVSFVSESYVNNGIPVIDADNMALTPGFIDVHSHSDFSIFHYSDAKSKLLQGVTTEVNGNCGFSASPIFNDAKTQMEKEFTSNGIEKRWESKTQYDRALSEFPIGLNIATLTGHGNIRGSVMGYENRKPTEDDLNQMARVLKEQVNAGCCGMSTGLIYLPGAFSDNAEIIEIIKRSGLTDIIYASHMRSEGDKLLESIGETLEVGRRTGVKVHISHLKTSGRRNWHKIGAVIKAIKQAISEGIRVTCDRYPYSASQTSLDAVLPPWVYEGGDEAELQRLKEGQHIRRLKEELAHVVGDLTYWDSVMVSTVKSDKNKYMEGKTIGELCRIKQVEPLDFTISLLIEEQLKVDAIYFSLSEDNLQEILKLPNCMVGSDSSLKSLDAIGGGKPHPRGFGSFPRYIRKYVLDESLMTLEAGIRKMTAAPAETFNLNGRGIIKEGAYADLVVFSIADIADGATYEAPHTPPRGIRHVFVNGQMAVKDGVFTGTKAGMIL